MFGEKKVLIVEDDPDINNLIAYNLQKEGFNIEQVFDGLSAQEKLKKESFNIVVLDIMLPGINGFDVCKMIKDDPRNFNTFIIVISAKSCQQDKLYAHLLGANYYLSKPFNLVDLLSTVRQISANLDKEFLVKLK
ncbi:MAG: response regulator [Candidatus Omnitrophica bacterium]|nr:response regulator [Candidatus Omnitrophota bacterium]MDD5661018.1 response regulator [Candidatus Omnitrophota bacterium]